MNNPPQITLLVPCYNAGRYLPRLIASARAQTRPFDAILCYDDGSTDDTVDVARSLGVEIITGNPNRGVAAACNQLATAARTEWIHIHGADDLLLPAYLATLANACDERHDVVSCDADWVDEIARNLMIPWRFDAAELTRAPFPYLLRHAMSLNSCVFRRSAWHAIGGCDESLEMWEDADLVIRLARHGARFHHVPDVLTLSLRHADSFSHDYRRNWACRVLALEHYAAGPRAPEVASILATEAEHAASALALLAARPEAERALALCRRLGTRPPTTRNPLLRLLKLVVPAYPLLRLQVRRRHRST